MENGYSITDIFRCLVCPTPRRFSGERPIKREHCVRFVVPCLVGLGVCFMTCSSLFVRENEHFFVCVVGVSHVSNHALMWDVYSKDSSQLAVL